MADSTNATPACNLVAIDVARYGNAVLVETTNGKRHRFKMVNSAADFSRLRRRSPVSVVRLGIELVARAMWNDCEADDGAYAP